MVVKRKLDSAVDESSAHQEIRKSNITSEKSGGLHLVELGLMAGRQSGRRNLGEA